MFFYSDLAAIVVPIKIRPRLCDSHCPRVPDTRVAARAQMCSCGHMVGEEERMPVSYTGGLRMEEGVLEEVIRQVPGADAEAT